uniref:Angel homolog 2 n=1 Tax=Seriola lalandi dorsalis TaxID=1841481 RepID=A0A3B4Y9J3_SERLL
MFLRRLSSLGSAFLPRRRPALCSASSPSVPQVVPAPHPWWSVQGFPPWPPRLPHTHPPARQVFTGRTLHPHNINHGNFGRSWRSFSTCGGLLMERSGRDREPPQKRRKSEEERRNEEERGRHTGGSVNLLLICPVSVLLASLSSALHRHWESSPFCSTYPQPPGVSAAFDFSVMSYNILSQELLQDNDYLYKHCDPAVLPWEYRLPNLLTEIQQLDADILCLQEVQEDHYENQIKPALQRLGYQCEYKKRTGRKPDGCAIIFKSSRLSLLSSNPVEFLRPSDALLDRDNVGLVVLLRPNHASNQSDPSAFICVANTHLLYNPRRGDIKLAQLAILLAEISRLSRLPDGSTNPVVLCGDFNSTPWSPLYSFLTTGRLDYRGLPIGMVSGQENVPRAQRLLTSPIWSQSLGINHLCQYENRPTADSSPTSRIEHGLKLQSTYQHHLMPDGRPEITTCHSRTAITVDYILLSLVGQQELQEVNSLPNQHHSSDHLPLLARFRFRR